MLERHTQFLDRGYYKIHITIDSQVAIKILTKKYQIPWRVMAITNHIHSILASMEIKILHTWRKSNQPLDFLASMRLGEGEKMLHPIDSPLNLKELIDMQINTYTKECNYFL